MDGNGTRTALVLGATGGIGGATAEALIAHGWIVRALVRDRTAAAKAWEGRKGEPEWQSGDAMNRDDVVRAAAGVDAIVHAVNPAGYRDWEQLVVPMIDNSIAAAKAAGGARIVLPGTIYNFDPDKTPVIGEDSPQHPITRKGAIRVQLEQRLEAAAGQGVPCLILRAGDFIGLRTKATWFAQVLVKPGKAVTRITHPGRGGIGHSWAYLPDLAEAFVALMEAGDRLRPFERLQFQGYWDADGREMHAAIARVTGRPGLPVKPFPWWLMRIIGLFAETPRELREIRPYWRAPVRLDNSRLVALLGAEPHTPLDQAIAVTLKGLGCLPSAS